MMKISLIPGCYKLDTAVCCVGLCLTAVYLLLGLGSVVWLVLCNSDTPSLVMEIREAYMMRMQTMMGSLVLMGTVLVIAFIGLLTCLLLILGIKTEQRLLLLPWQLYHAAIILGCFGGGFYQALHFSVLTERDDSLLACLSLFPVVGGIFFIFIWLLVHQQAIRMRYRRQVDKIVEEKRASLASIHQSLQNQVPNTLDQVKPSTRNKKTRERWRGKYKSEENILTVSGAGTVESPYYWLAGRARSLPRHLDRVGDRESCQRNSGEYEDSKKQHYAREVSHDSGTSMQRIKSQPDIATTCDGREQGNKWKNKERDLHRSCHNLYRHSDTLPCNHSSLWLADKHSTQATTRHSLHRQGGKQGNYHTLQREGGKQTSNHISQRDSDKQESYHTLRSDGDKQTGYHTLQRDGDKKVGYYTLQRDGDKQASYHTLQKRGYTQAGYHILQRDGANGASYQTLQRNGDNQASYRTLQRDSYKQASCQILQREGNKPGNTLQRDVDKHPNFHTLQKKVEKHVGYHSLHRHVDKQPGYQREGDKQQFAKSVSIDPEVTEYTYQQKEHR